MTMCKTRKSGICKRCGYVATAAALAIMITAGACAGTGSGTESAVCAETGTYAPPTDESFPKESLRAEAGSESIEFRADGSDVTLLIRKPPVFEDIFFDNPDFVNGTAVTDEYNVSGFYKTVREKSAGEFLKESLVTDWMVEHEDYTNVDTTQVGTFDAGGRTVSYARVRYDYRDITTYVYYSCAEAGNELVTVTIDCTVAKGGSDPIGKDGIYGVWDNISVQ